MVHFLDISCSFERAHGRILLDYTFAMLDLTNVESRKLTTNKNRSKL